MASFIVQKRITPQYIGSIDGNGTQAPAYWSKVASYAARADADAMVERSLGLRVIKVEAGCWVADDGSWGFCEY